MKRITITDVAREAGVAVSTVSFVLNRLPADTKLKESTRQKVLEVASRLGYRPNQLARAMVRGHTQTIGFFAPYIAAEWIAEVLHGFSETASESHYFVKALSVDSENWRNVLGKVLDSKPAAIACHELLHSVEVPLFREAKAQGLYCGVVGESTVDGWDCEVRVNTDAAAEQVVSHLVQLGHRQILHLSGKQELGSGLHREQSYRRAMKKFGISPKVFRGDYEIASTALAARKILDSPSPPTAIYCANDPMALVVMRTARSLGLKIPEDLSVVGYSDLLMAQLSDPPLTTVNERLSACGRFLAHKLISHLQKTNSNGGLSEPPKPELVVRHSTGPARG